MNRRQNIVLFSFLLLWISQPCFAEKDEAALVGEISAAFAPSSSFKFDAVDVDGMGFAGRFRFGYQIEYIHLYMLGQYSVWNYSSRSTTLKGPAFGAGLGWEWNIPLVTNIEFYATSLGSNQSNQELSGGFGSGVELGYYINQSFKLFLGYDSRSYEVDEVKYKVSAITTGVSFPFDISYPSTWWRTRKTDSPPKLEVFEKL